MIKNRIVYMATPYSKYRGGIQQAFIDASRIAGALMANGNRIVFCPIAHSHPIAVYGNLDPMDYTIWYPLNEAMMMVATELVVVKMRGWSDSIGVQHEIKMFREMGKPITFLEINEAGLAGLGNAIVGQAQK